MTEPGAFSWRNWSMFCVQCVILQVNKHGHCDCPVPGQRRHAAGMTSLWQQILFLPRFVSWVVIIEIKYRHPLCHKFVRPINFSARGRCSAKPFSAAAVMQSCYLKAGNHFLRLILPATHANWTTAAAGRLLPIDNTRNVIFPFRSTCLTFTAGLNAWKHGVDRSGEQKRKPVSNFYNEWDTKPDAAARAACPCCLVFKR